MLILFGQFCHINIMTFLEVGLLADLGQGFSIAALALVMPFCFAFRSYLRFLDFLQFLYLFALFLNSNNQLFSDSLSHSWVMFDQNIFYFCAAGEMVCTVGFALSFGACLLAFLLLMRLIVLIEARRKRDIRFEPVYTFFKGLTRWIYAPLSYYSAYYLIRTIQGKADSLIASAVIVGVVVLFPLCQLIGYKIIQGPAHNIWPKWLEFINFYRILGICSLVAFSITFVTNIPLYVIYGVEAIYGLVFVLKHNFCFPMLGRVTFVLGEGMLISLYSFYLFMPDYLVEYHLDFILMGALLVMDLVMSVAELVSYCRNGWPDQSGGRQVAPEAELDPPRKKKGNSYDIELNDMSNQFGNNSLDDIDLKTSPKRNKSPNRRK